MSNSISNVTIDTVCHNVPLAARSSRKAENAPDIPPATVFAQAAPPQQANGKDTRTKSAATKNGGIPEVPPLSDYTRRYLDWDLSTTVASYVARLTTEVRSFREWFARANDTAVAREILDDFFHEVKEFEDTYQGRKAALGLSQDTKGHINNEDANYSARDDVDNSKLSDDGATDDDEEDDHEELFDSLHVEETLEHGDMSIVDDNDLHFKVVSQETEAQSYGGRICSGQCSAAGWRHHGGYDRMLGLGGGGATHAGLGTGESEQERALWEGTATARDDPERGTRRGGRKDAGEGPAGWRTVPAGLRAVRAARRASRAPAGFPAGDGAGVGSVRAWASLADTLTSWFAWSP
ncbi:hypothetical protein WOLCODRAFT_166155 [Wolfiporia cocos MD-104 SS10]|uniref:Uncharacterized protein n=1 Tax=Wolfiporia cocos (strain MD-104) TaxID=742152 RepID=A0A2H3J658_WOLCO|nr:hypothetical protein WOLCODRAFT_166155 [Wolfiporia cocos MD-104 SS10]